MKNKACIIITYFGRLDETANIFIQSCKNNPEFTWLIFSDCEYKNAPRNVKFINTNLEMLKELIQDKLNMKISLEQPYKMCDFRPAYGIIFKDYLKDYDFWGYGDMDVIYGNLSKFITDDIMDKNDKIYICGHLSFLRNNEECNNAYKVETKNSANFRDVFTDSKSWIFDEYRGLNEKLVSKKLNIYSRIDFVDIDLAYKRLRRTDKKTINLVFPKYLFKKELPKNYNYQIFVWENGKAYYVYFDKKEAMHMLEVSYIHYRKKISCCKGDFTAGRYLITNEGIIKNDDNISIDLIREYNDYPGRKYEQREYRAALKNSIITELGKNKKLVKAVRGIKRYLGGSLNE